VDGDARIESGSAALEAWAAEQRALARALNLSLDEWLAELEAAAERRTGLTAAVVGAAVAHGLGLSVLERLHPEKLLDEARRLIDPRPPKAQSPVLREAIRRAEELGASQGQGRSRLKRREPKSQTTPERRSEIQGARSARARTADAPGDDE
jgi:transcriptional regulator with XRE-family HTH domain